MAYAFRCNSCQSLAGSDEAGERDLPLKCRTCGKGAHYKISVAGAPVMITEPENWTILADLDGNGIADILEYHGLESSDIAAHVPFVTTAKKDVAGALVYDENSAVVLETAPREGPAAEPVAPKHVAVEAVEALGTTDTTEVSA